MENSTTQLEALASEVAEPPSCSFPPYRHRRPLRSHTLHTLVRILSHCPCEGGNGAGARKASESVGTEIRGGVEQNGKSHHDQIKPVGRLGARSNHKGLEVDPVKKRDVDKNKESTGCQNGGFQVGNGQVTSPELSQEDLFMDRMEGVGEEHSITVDDFLMEENQTDDAVEIVKELEDVNGTLGFQTDGFSSIRQPETDMEFTVQDLCEVLNSAFGDAMDLQSSEAVENNKDAGYILDGNKLVGFEHDLQLKGVELEKLISNPCVMDSNVHVPEVLDIGEGEISGDAGIADALPNELSEDAASPGDKSTELAHGSEDNVNKQLLTCNYGERGHWRDGMPNLSTFNTSASGGGSKKSQLRETIMQMQDSDCQNVLRDRDMMANKSSLAAPCMEKLSPSRRKLPGNDAESQSAAAIQDGDVNKKKRKKGPLTDERKAKKKKKERIKRAEKNRKLGINRLKLPVSKPNTPKPCRHYLQGRCHEGGNCKFSHDVVPLTKSKPCSYFARQSCMKGDDCPFDHVLSKYPCDNYATKGFCSRGSDCLFSHMIPANQTSTTTASTSKPVMNSQQHRVPENEGSHIPSAIPQPYMKLTSPVNKSNSSTNVDNHAIFHGRVDAKVSSGGTSSNKKAEKHSEPARTAKHTPKGVSFLLNGGTSVGDPGNQKRDGSSSNVGGGTDVHEKILDGPVGSNKSNALSVPEAPKKPRGINFLSFTQKSALDDTSSKTLSNLFSNVHNGKGKPGGIGFLVDKPSQLADSGRGIEASKQVNQNAPDLVQNLNGTTNNIPQPRVPEPVSNLFPGKIQSYDSVNAKISSSLRISPLSNTPGLVQKAVQSTLAFAAKFEPNIKLNCSHNSGDSRISEGQSRKSFQ